MTRLHALVVRTNAKGVPFVGRCQDCGKENITWEMMQVDECQGKMTQEEALLRAVRGGKDNGQV